MSFLQASTIIAHSPLLGQNQTLRQEKPACSLRLSIRPLAMLEVVRLRGRRWGLLAQYEESRLAPRLTK